MDSSTQREDYPRLQIRQPPPSPGRHRVDVPLVEGREASYPFTAQAAFERTPQFGVRLYDGE